MQRSEAMCYLRAVLEQDREVSPSAITLEKNKTSNGYIVRIKQSTRNEAIREVAKKRKLVVREEADDLIVYKPL